MNCPICNLPLALEWLTDRYMASCPGRCAFTGMGDSLARAIEDYLAHARHKQSEDDRMVRIYMQGVAAETGSYPGVPNCDRIKLHEQDARRMLKEGKLGASS